MDITARKHRLDAAADAAAKARVHWFGTMAEVCTRCGVEVPADFQIALPNTEITGCLRCLEWQSYLYIGGLAALPDDLAGSGDQAAALRQVAEEFRRFIRAVAAGRAPVPRGATWIAREASDFDDNPASMSTLSRSRPDRPARGQWRNAPAPDDATVSVASTRWPKRPASDGTSKSTRHSRQQPASAAPGWQTPETSASAVLGLVADPSRDEVLAAFRRSALICHPDHGGSDDALRALIKARDELLAALT